MSGIINKPGTPPGLSNKLLRTTEQAIEARLTPDARTDYLKVVVAGLHIALAKGANGFMAKIAQAPDPIAELAKGAVNLVLVMKKDAKGVMPMEAMVPAGLALMLHGLQFLERSGTKIAEPEIDRGTTIFTNEMFHRLGITPKMLESATRKVNDVTRDPDAMAKINLKAGLTRHPQAAIPTQIPGIPPVGAAPAGAPAGA